MQKTVLKRVVIDGTEYLLPKKEVDYSNLIYRGRKTPPPVDNEGFAVFVEISIFALLFAAHMVLAAFS